jgi:hypothetical protein
VNRKVRAVALIGTAVVAVLAASLIYLHPAATEVPFVARALTTTDLPPKRVVILNPGTDVYFTWRLAVVGGSGGHRAG